MLKFTSLASGSSGNATLIEHNGESILIDCGLSCKRMGERFDALEVDKAGLKGIFVTHEHSDHISGLRVTGNKWKVPAYTNATTGLFLQHKGRTPEEVLFFENGQRINIGPFLVEPFSIPHDGVDTVAYIVYCGEKKVAVATDFGYASHLLKERLKDCDAMVLESNYEPDMLLNCSKRPWSLKQRILGRHGHLSNPDSLDLLEEIASPRLKNLIMGHVSEDTNDYGLVHGETQKRLELMGRSDIHLQVARQGMLNPTVVL